jgi:hypothetical protein
MKQTIYQHDFINAFKNSDTYKNNFSYEGLQLLFNYLEDYENDTGEQIELDIVALCCEYSEDTIENIIMQFGIDVSNAQDEADRHQIVVDYLNDNSYVIGETVSNSYLYQVF